MFKSHFFRQGARFPFVWRKYKNPKFGVVSKMREKE